MPDVTKFDIKTRHLSFFLESLPSCAFRPAAKGFSKDEKKSILETHNHFRQQVKKLTCFEFLTKKINLEKT